jgi:ABC-type sulfate/molybdate transport systems ATPase subunit
MPGVIRTSFPVASGSICIARALALNPKVVIADESVSALDVSIRAQIINLLLDLQRDMGIAFLFISHDMAVVERISHRVAVMYMGQIVEIGPRRAVFENPQHPYTRKLMAAVPVADPEHRHAQRVLLQDEMPGNIRKRGERMERVTLREVGRVILSPSASGQCILAVITYNRQENTMVKFVARTWLLAASVTAALAAAPRSLPKMSWLRLARISRPSILMTLTTRSRRRSPNLSIRGYLAWIKR